MGLGMCIKKKAWNGKTESKARTRPFNFIRIMGVRMWDNKWKALLEKIGKRLI